MHELTGKMLPTLTFSARGQPVISFEFNEKSAALKMADELKDQEKICLNIDKFFEKRSKGANSYLWKLCGLIADALSEDGIPHTKDEIYKSAVKARGIYREQGELDPDFAKTVRTAWEMIGKGWVTEQVDFEPDGEKVIVRFYYGSSTYNTKQMSRIIDWLLEDCRQYGIETKSKEEIASLLNQWKGGIPNG